MERKWADPTALGDLTIGLLIFAQTFFMLGVIDSACIISLIPWILAAYPVLLIVTVIQFRVGNFLGATSNGLLGAVLMGQNFVKGIIELLFVLNGKNVPEALTAGSHFVDAMAFIVGGVILLFVGYLVCFKSNIGAISTWCIGIGFIFIALNSFGFGEIFGLLGACGVLVVAAWLVYSGIGMTVNTVLNKTVFPMGKPLIKMPESVSKK